MRFIMLFQSGNSYKNIIEKKEANQQTNKQLQKLNPNILINSDYWYISVNIFCIFKLWEPWDIRS